jgi:hypothetical protein
MVTLVSVVQWALPDSDVTDRSVRLVIAAAVGALVYSAALLWQGGVMVREIAEVGSWILGRNRAVPVAK